MARGIPAIVTPEVLQWARDLDRITIDEIAQKLNVDAAKVTLPNQARPIPTPIILFLNGCAMRYNFVFLFSMSQNAKVNTIVHKNGINSAQNLQIAGLLFSGIGSNPASNAQPMKKNNCFS